jgi:hypothetical protein
MAAVRHEAGDAEWQPFEPRLESRVMDVVLAARRARLAHGNKIPEIARSLGGRFSIAAEEGRNGAELHAGAEVVLAALVTEA